MNNDPRRALYFGYLTGGHFLHDQNNKSTLEPKRYGLPWSIGLLDTGLLKNGKHIDIYDGRVFWTCGGSPLWFAFFWWDRSGDTRANSNSGFYVRGFDLAERQQAFDYAALTFPKVMARQTHLLVLQP